MPRFYVEIPHESEKNACLRSIQVLQQTGSHFITNADYGCLDGDHTARIVIEVDNKHDALMVVPPVFRPIARVVQLNKFTPQEINALLEAHNK